MRPPGSRNKVKGKAVNRGYFEIFEPKHPLARRNGYVGEHRMIMYDVGLLDDPKLEVHHRNGDRKDNRIENLQVMTKAEHTSLTWKGVKRKPNAPTETGNPLKN